MSRSERTDVRLGCRFVGEPWRNPTRNTNKGEEATRNTNNGEGERFTVAYKFFKRTGCCWWTLLLFQRATPTMAQASQDGFVGESWLKLTRNTNKGEKC